MRELRATHPELAIAVDGGLNRETARTAWDAGANVFDVGSSFFKVEDMGAEVRAWREMLV
jgi:pentose-5-phosphate-3-epimerase